MMPMKSTLSVPSTCFKPSHESDPIILPRTDLLSKNQHECIQGATEYGSG